MRGPTRVQRCGLRRFGGRRRCGEVRGSNRPIGDRRGVAQVAYASRASVGVEVYIDLALSEADLVAFALH